jgi:hypothetical protein
MCKKTLPGLGKECPSCKADVSLLVTYVEDLDNSLVRAEAHTRAGELGDAVWAYLEVLEVDPDNETARRQVGRVAAAVRQFDRLAQGRRWLDRLQTSARLRQWLNSWGTEGSLPKPVLWLLALLLIVVSLLVGFALGHGSARQVAPGSSAAESSSEN